MRERELSRRIRQFLRLGSGDVQTLVGGQAYNPAAVAITGGTIEGVTDIGATSPVGQVVSSKSGGGTGAAFYANTTSGGAGSAWNDASQAVNNRLWDVVISAGVFALRVVNDGNSIANAAYSVTRSGTTVTQFKFGARASFAQGAAVASAANVTLGNDGNRFQISGTTTINLLDSTDVQGGSIVVLHFQGILTVTHNVAASGAFKPIFLIAGANLTTAAKKQVTLQYDSTDSTWYQIA